MTAPIILAIDPGTQHTGWCVGQGDRYIGSGAWNLGDGGVWERLGRFAARLHEMLNRYAPDVIAVEEPTGNHKNSATDRKLGAAFGVVLTLAALSDVELISVHPMTIKATGLHKGLKNSVFWSGLIGRPVSTEDEADAVGAWQAARRVLMERELRGVGKKR